MSANRGRADWVWSVVAAAACASVLGTSSDSRGQQSARCALEWAGPLITDPCMYEVEACPRERAAYQRVAARQMSCQERLQDTSERAYERREAEAERTQASIERRFEDCEDACTARMHACQRAAGWRPNAMERCEEEQFPACVERCEEQANRARESAEERANRASEAADAREAAQRCPGDAEQDALDACIEAERPRIVEQARRTVEALRAEEARRAQVEAARRAEEARVSDAFRRMEEEPRRSQDSSAAEGSPRAEESPRAQALATGANSLGDPPPDRASNPPSPGLRDFPGRDDVLNTLRPLMPQIRQCAGSLAGIAPTTLLIRNDGTVTSVSVQGSPFGGTPQGACMAGVIRAARFGPFRQSTFRLTYPFDIR
jgi:hypothetical protein